MTPFADTTTNILAFSTLGVQIASVVLLVALIAHAKFLSRLAPYVLPFALLITFAGSALTLLYSEVFGFAPCFLCWVQRAFLYPMPLLLLLALWKQSDAARKAVLGLSVPGAIVALYQHYLQIGGESFVPCPAVPGAADCGKRLIFEFGYITFPLMAFSVFVFVFLLMLVAAKRKTV